MLHLRLKQAREIITPLTQSVVEREQNDPCAMAQVMDSYSDVLEEMEVATRDMSHRLSIGREECLAVLIATLIDRYMEEVGE